MSVLASAGVWLLSATSTPTPPAKAPDPNSVTPGVLGFLVVFVLAIITWLLMRNLTARLRRMRFREEQRLATEAEPPSTDVPPTG